MRLLHFGRLCQDILHHMKVPIQDRIICFLGRVWTRCTIFFLFVGILFFATCIRPRRLEKLGFGFENVLSFFWSQYYINKLSFKSPIYPNFFNFNLDHNNRMDNCKV